MLGRTLLAATALVAAFAIPAAAPEADAAVRDTVTLSNNDNGHTVHAHSGDRLSVHLTTVPGKGVKWVWDKPTASSPSVLQRLDGRVLGNGDAVAHFRSAHTGRSDITAHRRCVVTSPGHRCPQLVQSWKVTVEVR
ncbi:hypothetical protein [Streptomyces orinoci]|uniref:Proteinase inhibitor I42 chagasin domain-containing protein n=1 Tax=Streptomyces orinoci TaxID=67339 RepID=A0ABV3K2B8_STRON|nr:hypothetical protein [Streptomyces orinoci]